MQASEPASAADAAAHAGPAAGRKPKEPIKFVAPPPKASPSNPNFRPRQAWPDGKYVKILPQTQLQPGQHRWKGSTGAAPHPSQQQTPSRLRANSGSVNMHSAVALELQSAGNGSRGHAGNGYSRLTSNGGGGGSDIDNAPEPGEVPAAVRKRIGYQPGDAYTSHGAGYGAACGAGSRPPLLADMYAKQLATGGRGLTGGSGGGSGSPANGGGRLRQRQPLTGQAPAGGTFDGAVSSGNSFGGAGGRTSPLQRPSTHGSSFAEGYEAADKTITAAGNNQWRLANSRAAVIAALPSGDEGDAARHGFRARIRKAQQEADQTGDAAFVAELEEYLQVALGGAGTADAGGGGRRAVALADAADSFSFRVNGSGAFGSSVSVEQGAEAGAEAGLGGGSGGRRNVAVFRRGSREVQVGDGGGSGGFGVGGAGEGGSGGSGSGAVGSFKGFKRKAPWQADGGGKAAMTHRKVVSVPASGGGSGGKPKFGKAAPGKPVAAKPAHSKPASAAAQQAPFKKPAAAAAAPPPSIGQKLSMSLDAIAGKPATKTAAKAAAGGSGSAGGTAQSSSGKHQPIAWQG